MIATHGIIQSGASYVGPLDAYQSLLSGGISFSRRLFTSYTANKAFRVRRSSDSTELDIGFTAMGLTDTTALLTFCGGGDGFVVTAYDQLGGNNFSQSTATLQPKIVSAGSVLTYNGAPAAVGDGVNDYLAASSSANWGTASIVMVMSVISGAGTSNKFFAGASLNAYGWCYLSGAYYSGTSLSCGAYSNGDGAVFGANMNGASTYLRNQAATTSGNGGAGGSGTATIFGRSNAEWSNIAINELLWVGGSVLSNGNLDAICAAQRGAFGL